MSVTYGRSFSLSSYLPAGRRKRAGDFLLFSYLIATRFLGIKITFREHFSATGLRNVAAERERKKEREREKERRRERGNNGGIRDVGLPLCRHYVCLSISPNTDRNLETPAGDAYITGHLSPI